MTSRSIVPLHSEPVYRAAKVIAARPGLTLEEIAAACFWTTRHTSKVLTALQQSDLGDYVRHAQHCCWYSKADHPAAVAEFKADQRRRALAKHRERNHRNKLRRLSEQQLDGPDVADQPIRRQVEASAPLPFKCRAPASVFHLGAML